MLVAYFCDGNMFYIYVSKPHMSPVVKSCAKPLDVLQQLKLSNTARFNGKSQTINIKQKHVHKPSHHFAG